MINSNVEMTDQQIILEAMQDTTAFNGLVERYHQRVVQALFYMYGDYNLAEEAAQEAFIKAWQRLSSYDPLQSFKSSG